MVGVRRRKSRRRISLYSQPINNPPNRCRKSFRDNSYRVNNRVNHNQSDNDEYNKYDIDLHIYSENGCPTCISAVLVILTMTINRRCQFKNIKFINQSKYGLNQFVL